jgi:hypothetical protein
MSGFEVACKVADAVLYEGYVLYPYRASSLKNRFRWQFGVVAPRAWSEEGGDPCEMRTECLIEPLEAPTVRVTIRFLQVHEREGGPGSFDGGIESRIEIPPFSCRELSNSVPFEFPDSGIVGNVRLSTEAIGGWIKLRVSIENETPFPTGSDRDAAMRRSLVGTHTLLSVSGGAFVSLTDPPELARLAAAACSNLNTWPVLVGAEGDRQILLSSPIILPDYPKVAPESPGDFCDATEIDEMLTLRVMTLTDEEKREACATDERARRIVERSYAIPPEMFERLHGALREMPAPNLEQFFNPSGEDPDRDSVETPGGTVAKGSRVRLAPKRRADAMDMFLAGRIAIVESVHRDVEDRTYVAVRVEGDETVDLHGLYHRFYYFHPDEIEAVEV